MLAVAIDGEARHARDFPTYLLAARDVARVTREKFTDLCLITDRVLNASSTYERTI